MLIVTKSAEKLCTPDGELKMANEAMKGIEKPNGLHKTDSNVVMWYVTRIATG